MSDPIFHHLSNNTGLWEKKYRNDFPETYKALQHPHPYWKFDDVGGRLFIYYATIEKETLEWTSEEANIVSHVTTKYTHNTHLQIAAACIIMRLSWSPRLPSVVFENNRNIFRDRKIFPHFISVLYNFDDPKLLSCVLGSLTNLSNNQTNSNVIISMNGVQVILDCLHRVKKDTVTDYGCSALANICRKHPSTSTFIIQNGLDLALNLLNKVNAELSILQAPLDLINVLVGKDISLKESLGKDILNITKRIISCCPPLAETTTQFSLSYACDAIECFCKNSSINKQHACYIDLPPLLYKILQLETDTDVLSRAFFAIYHIYWKETIPQDFYKKLIALVEAMLDKYQVDGLFLIGPIAILADFAQMSPENQLILRKFGLGPKVKETVKRFAKSPEDLSTMVDVFF
eukprot:TRINITY_DN21538_c0_g1_i1.p1 TRINITY_DN21538_c0_g1~~TRINITY_DN21538_c0_g1_i1.p1  ORF type:complete len:439 (-),score=86.82 TRINITY_DN21538_c0_g1_i1:78-1289(-)